MKPTFSKFAQINEGRDYGITHVEDLDVESFIRAIERLHELTCVQKLDGANLMGGIDVHGQLYTSREQKGGKRFYKQSDFPNTSAYDGFRAAHAVLVSITDDIRTVVSPGEAFSLEVLFGHQPNTVFYGKEGMNYLAFLEMVPGDDPSIEPDQKIIDKIEEILADRTIAVKTTISDTTDGIQIMKAPRLSDWKITKSDHVPSIDVRQIDVSKTIEKLKGFLKADNTQAQKIGKDLTNFEVLKDRTQDLAEERKRLLELIMNNYKLPIKKTLLKLVYKQKPSLRAEGSASDGAYKGIEGIIFVDPKTRERFKVVDKDVFTRINQFNYQVRKTLAGRITSANKSLPIEMRGGIVGEAKLRCMNLFGLENAEIPSQAKKVIAKLKGDSRETTMANLVKTLNQLKFEPIKRKMQAIYVSALTDLEEALETFKQNAAEYKLELEDGEVIKYTAEIKRRTLLVFAEARRTLNEMIKSIREARDIDDLVEIFFGKQIDSVSKK